MAKVNLDIKKISTTLALPNFESLNCFQYASRFLILGIISLKVAKSGLSFPKKIPKFLTFFIWGNSSIYPIPCPQTFSFIVVYLGTTCVFVLCYIFYYFFKTTILLYYYSGIIHVMCTYDFFSSNFKTNYIRIQSKLYS